MKGKSRVIICLLGVFIYISTYIVMDFDFQRIMVTHDDFVETFQRDSCDSVTDVYKYKEDERTHILIICETESMFGPHIFLLYSTKENRSIYTTQISEQPVLNLQDAPESYQEYLTMFDEEDQIFTLKNITLIKTIRYITLGMIVCTIIPTIKITKSYVKKSKGK